MRLPRTRLCLLSPVLSWRRLVGKVLVVALVLPGLAAASPEALQPIKLRKTWQSSTLEPIHLKRPDGMAGEALPSGLPDWTPVPPTEIHEIPVAAPTEIPANLAPVATAPAPEQITTGAVTEHVQEATVVNEPDELTESAEVPATPPAPTPTADEKRGFSERIQSLADAPRDRGPDLPANTVLPVNLGRIALPEEGTQPDDDTVNKIIDIADQYADVSQLLLEVRGLAPMTATDPERQQAYRRAQLVMSGLVSAGIPYYRIAAFVTLMDAAPRSVDILRVR